MIMNETPKFGISTFCLDIFMIIENDCGHEKTKHPKMISKYNTMILGVNIVSELYGSSF